MSHHRDRRDMVIGGYRRTLSDNLSSKALMLLSLIARKATALFNAHLSDSVTGEAASDNLCNFLSRPFDRHFSWMTGE